MYAGISRPDRSQQQDYDYSLKLIIIGDAGAGKSCLLHQFLEGRFKKPAMHTIGVEFGTKIINVNGKRVKLQIWDTAGQERYRAVTRSYYRGALGALVLYDTTSRESYNHLPNWLQDAKEQAWKNISLIAVGNKRDLKEQRRVSYLEASRIAQESDVLFMETSALTGEGVEETFQLVVQRILNKIAQGVIDPDSMVSGILAENRRNREIKNSEEEDRRPDDDGFCKAFWSCGKSSSSGGGGGCMSG